MKRRWCVVLVLLALVSSVFPGGQRQNQGGAAIARPVGRQDPFEPYNPPITLTTVRTLNSTIMFDASDPEKRSLDENRWVRVFREEMGINYSHLWISSDGDSELAKWNAGIASGLVPDFAVVTDAEYKVLYDADMLADMTEIFPNYASDHFAAMLTESDYQAMSPAGRLLGFPGPNKGYNGSSLLFIRKDWLAKVGLPLPTTIDDVVAIAQAFKDAKLAGNDTIGLLFSSNISGGVNFTGADGKWDGFFNGYGAYLNYWLVKDGKLAYSNIQPEFRRALLAMQDLYRKGLTNRDIAVLTDEVAREYIASGKAGIFYSTAWNVTQSMYSLHNTDPNVEFYPVFPPSAVGGAYPIQTNMPSPQRIFVSAAAKYPEAIVKMANFCDRARMTANSYYYEDEKGFQYYKFLPWSQFSAGTDDLDRGEAFRHADATGTEEKLDTDFLKRGYQTYLEAKEGKAPFYQLTMFGKDGSFTLLWDAYHAGKILANAYMGLPTETQTLLGDTIADQLSAAMYEVATGADISVYDRAVENWLRNGGRKITDEVNVWYSALRK